MTTDVRRPRDEELLLALANTGHDGPDELRDAASVRAWWEAQRGVGSGSGLPAAREDDLALLRAARELLRALTLRNNGGRAEVEASALGGLTLRFVLDDVPGLAVAGSAALPRTIAAETLAALLRTSARPDWGRFKACPGPDCRWVFVDRSRNGSRRWCDMAACGNRAKGAAFRERTRTRDGRASRRSSP